MRLPYTSNPPIHLTETEQPILPRILSRRGPRGLIPLDLTLLHSPPIADGWNSLLGAVRTQTSLSPAIRELAICRVALLNRAWFEWDAHLPLLLATAGWGRDTEEGKTKESVVRDPSPGERGALSEREWVVLRYADAMTREVQVEEWLFGQVKGLFSEKEVVEITATVATYNMVSRFLVALDVGEKNENGMGV